MDFDPWGKGQVTHDTWEPPADTWDGGGDMPQPEGVRKVHLTPASAIQVRPVHWLWEGRLPLGSLSLLGGREGIGKSTVAYQIAADITRGTLRGSSHRRPRSVIVAATEDSWEHTIVPRLMAAHADLDKVFRADVVRHDGTLDGLSLPRDLRQLEQSVRDTDAALILLDPLMSRLDGKLDTHKDAEVRLALEPLVRLADQTRTQVLGLIHVNKSGGSDALTTIMGSRAFSAVARSVLFVVVDPEDETNRILGLAKNNLGRLDLPSLTFHIASAKVADTDEGPVFTGRIQWSGETDRTLSEVLEASNEGRESRSAATEAADWLMDWLAYKDGSDDSASIKAAGQKAGHSKDALHRARRRLPIGTRSEGFPRKTVWFLEEDGPDQPVGAAHGETHTTATTATTGGEGAPVVAVGAVGAVGAHPPHGALTDPDFITFLASQEPPDYDTEEHTP